MRSQRERIEECLADGKWHSGAELNRIAFRYTARLHEMKQAGICWEKRYPTHSQSKNPPYEYRLVPEEETR